MIPAARTPAVWALAMTVLVVACAVSVPPPGGPEDRTPPSVSSTVPTADSAGVAVDSPLRIEFDEGMVHRGMERYIEFSPPATIEKIGWDGSTAVVRVEGGWRADTTYVVTLKSGYQDAHKVAAKNTVRFAFATSAAIDTGKVAGHVRFRREPTEQGIVYCYALRDTEFVFAATRPDREAHTGEAGEFSIGYLGSNNRTYILWAFQDRNNDGFFSPEQDVGFAGADTVTLTASSPAIEEIDIAIVDPDEPCIVNGRVVNESGIDSLFVSVGLYADADTIPPAYYTVCDTTGFYEFGNVHAGHYLLKAFVDVHADSVCAGYPCGPDSSQVCAEPCVTHPDSVIVEPGDTKKMTPVELGRAREGEAP